MADLLDIAEPTLKAAVAKLRDLGIDERAAGRLMVLFGLQCMTDSACCQRHLAEELAATAEMIDDAINEIAEGEALH